MATDYDRFIREAHSLRGDFFDRGRPITVARAPGWVDLIGGAAPAGGPLALGWPLGHACFVALQPDPDPTIRLRDGSGELPPLPMAALAQGHAAPREYAEIATSVAGQAYQVRLAAAAWAALMREEFVRFPGGARALVHTTATPGWPIALTAAIAQALVSAYEVRLAPRELGLSVAVGSARVAGHDPGALGALVTVCAHSGSLLLLHQQPAWLWGDLHLPPGATIWALRVDDGNDDHGALTRVATAMAYQMLCAAGPDPAHEHARLRGYPANVGTAPFTARLGALLPETVSGAAFLAEYGPVAGVEVDPDAGYAVRAAASLAVEEHLRARTAAALLRAAASKAQRDDDLHLVGELMAQSQGSQGAAGFGDPHADALAERVYAAGPAQGLFGAREPAAASGASLVVLGRADAEPALRSIAEEFAASQGVAVTIHGGTSAGCSPAGTREI
jgi:hypothetical protein